VVAPSARLILRGRFETVDGLNETHQYNCVIKCAVKAAASSPCSGSVESLRREHEIYLEAQRLAGRGSSGCVRLYAAHPEHHYLVLEDHGADLRALLRPSLRFPQHVLEAVVAAVYALHSLGIMHGDIKPQNLLYKLYDHGYVVKLCDLDAAYKVGEICPAASLGTRHYHAPELRAAALRGDSITAALAIDMFSLGLVMWQVLARTPHAALDSSEVAVLYASQERLDAHLSYASYYKEDLQRVTCVNPVHRMNIADLQRAVKSLSGSSAQQGWQHEKEELHRTRHVWGEHLSEISESLKEIRSNQIVLGRKMTELLVTNTELATMVRALTANTHGLPTLVIILPVVSTSWNSRFSPMRLVRDQYRLHFLCGHTHQLAPCGPKGKGYKITMTKQWVLDAAPVLRVGLVLLKVALLASGLPLPVPDLCSALVDKAMHSKYLDAALQLVTNPPDGVRMDAEYTMQQPLDAVSDHDYSDYKEPGAEMRLQEGSRKAYETIKEILGRDGVNIPLTCGLRQVTHRGKTAWVLDSDVTERDWRSAVDSAV
jgi:serine/threonine protein kinase